MRAKRNAPQPLPKKRPRFGWYCRECACFHVGVDHLLDDAGRDVVRRSFQEHYLSTLHTRVVRYGF